jgi:hypothetical protein
MVLLVALVLAVPAFAGHQPTSYRNPAQVRAFKKLHACPGGPDKGSHSRCTGYVVDHKKALACGGADRPSNMAYQTIAAAKAKDKWELKQPGCPGVKK